MSKQSQSQSPILPLVAAVLTVILILGAATLVVLDRLEIARGRPIEDSPQTPLLLTLVCGGLFLIAAGWLAWVVKRQGLRHILAIILTGITALMLVITPLVAWQAFTSGRQLTVISMTCDAEDLRSTGGMALTNCEKEPVDTIVLLGGVQSDDLWTPDETTDNLTREIHDLPAGDWEAMLTVDGPPDTVAVSAVGIRGDEDVRLGSFRPFMDAESGMLRWTSRVRLDEEISTVRVQFFLSANPAVASASIRFDVMECRGQTIRTFDPSQCSPMDATAPFVLEKTPAGPRTWRHPYVTREGTTVVITNLEARTYELQPDYPGIELYTQSTDVLIIPSAMPQVADNSVVVPGASTFDVEIDATTGELSYIIYVFPTGPTFAGGAVAEA